MIRVVLCDDHAVVRRGIRDTLAEAVDIQVTGEAGGYAEVRELLDEQFLAAAIARFQEMRADLQAAFERHELR